MNLQMLKKAMLAYVSSVKFIWSAIAYPLSIVGKKLMNLRGYRVYGNSYQSTAGGKNLLHSNVSTLTLNTVTLTYDNGTITLNGTCTTSANFELGNIFLKAGTYTLSANANKVPVSNDYAFVQLYDATNNQTIQILNLNALDDTTKTTSLDGTFKYRIRIDKGTTYDNIVLQPQLEEGTTATEYEPYIPAPSPEYPSEIECVGDFSTKNLFDISDFISFYTPYWALPTEYGYHDEVGEECLKVYGTINADGRALYYMENRFKENTSYTFSLDCYDVFSPTNNISGISFICRYTDETSEAMFPYEVRKNKIWKKHSFTSDPNKTVKAITVSCGTGSAYSYLKNIQIEEGTTATDYEPYHKYKIPVLARGKNLLPIPTFGTFTQSGVTFTNNKDGTITINGTPTGYAGTPVISLPDSSLEVLRNNACVLTGFYKTSSSNVSMGIDVYLDSTLVKQYYINTSSANYTKVDLRGLNFNNVKCIVKRDSNNQIIDNLTVKPFLEVGTTMPTSFEPYIAPVTTNIFLDEPLRKVGNYADYVDFEKQKVVRNIKRKDFDGSEDWTIQSVNGEEYHNFYTDIILNARKPMSILSNRITGYNQYPLENNGLISSTGRLNVCFSANTIDDWKATLSSWSTDGIPLIINYILETPTEETVNLPALPQFKGTTIYEVGTNIKPSGIEVKYC